MSRQLSKAVLVGGVIYPEGTKVSDEVAEQITNPDVWADDGDGQPDPDPDSTPDPGDPGPAPAEPPLPSYKGVVKADLQKEIDKRNEGRDEEHLIKPEADKVAALVAALEADDKATAEAAAQS
jgi:hypothetical protein